MSTPKVSLGLEIAATLRAPEAELSWKLGSKEVPSNPVTLLAPISARLATTLAVFGSEVRRPKVKFALPVMLDSTATS